jgi:mannose-6-phosphate isomerase-like protein (cupin superfamily)
MAEAAGNRTLSGARTLRHVAAPDGAPLLDGRMLLKISADESNEAYTLCLGVTPAGLGPPLHLHAFDDQTHYVVRGTYELISGPDVAIAGPGACVHMPRFTPHTFRNITDEPAEIVEFTAPGGIDRYFDAVAHLGPVAMDLEARNAIGRAYGMSFPEHPEDYLEPPPGETRRPFTLVAEGEGRRLDWPGCDAICKIDAAVTDGSHSLIEVSLADSAVATLPRVEQAALVVVSGSVVVRAADEETRADPGDTVAVLGVDGVTVSADGGPATLIVYVLEDQR